MQQTDHNLEGKVALVTGASRGIGQAIATQLARRGATLALAAREESALDSTVAGLEPGKLSSRHAADLREDEAAPALVSAVLARHGRLDILVNNAGGSVAGGLTDLSDKDWIDALQLKLLGGMRVSRAAWPALAETKGSLINIVGIAGKAIDARGIVAATQCSAYYALTKALALQGLEDGVQVNAINPGPVWTDRLKGRVASLGIDPGLPEEQILEALARKMALRRIGRPEDIAGLVDFILSPAGGLFHGSLIDFDGGAAKGL